MICGMTPPASSHALAPATLIGLALLASPATGEGARLVFDCTQLDGVTAEYDIAPVAVDDTGAGEVTVTHAGQVMAGQSASFLGPWSWASQTDRETLLVDAPAQAGRLNMLHHRVPLDGTTPGTLTHLTCEAAL